MTYAPDRELILAKNQKTNKKNTYINENNNSRTKGTKKKRTWQYYQV